MILSHASGGSNLANKTVFPTAAALKLPLPGGVACRLSTHLAPAPRKIPSTVGQPLLLLDELLELLEDDCCPELELVEDDDVDELEVDDVLDQLEEEPLPELLVLPPPEDELLEDELLDVELLDVELLDVELLDVELLDGELLDGELLDGELLELDDEDDPELLELDEKLPELEEELPELEEEILELDDGPAELELLEGGGEGEGPAANETLPMVAGPVSQTP